MKTITKTQKPKYGVQTLQSKVNLSDTRHQVDEDNAKPVIDIEVDVGVVLDERSQFRSTAYHRLQSKPYKTLSYRRDTRATLVEMLSYCCTNNAHRSPGQVAFSPRP